MRKGQKLSQKVIFVRSIIICIDVIVDLALRIENRTRPQNLDSESLVQTDPKSIAKKLCLLFCRKPKERSRWIDGWIESPIL